MFVCVCVYLCVCMCVRACVCVCGIYPELYELNIYLYVNVRKVRGIGAMGLRWTQTETSQHSQTSEFTQLPSFLHIRDLLHVNPVGEHSVLSRGETGDIII